MEIRPLPLPGSALIPIPIGFLKGQNTCFVDALCACLYVCVREREMDDCSSRTFLSVGIHPSDLRIVIFIIES